MTNVAAGIIGAFLSLVGVVTGVWLNGRREHKRWIRDQQLKAAVEFIGAAGELYAENRGLRARPASDDELKEWDDAVRNGRSALYLLSDHATVDLAEELIKAVRHTEKSAAATHDPDTVALLRSLTQHLRRELGVAFDLKRLDHSVVDRPTPRLESKGDGQS